MLSGGHAWQWACVVGGGGHCVVEGGMCGRRDGHYAPYWNAFLYLE